MAGVVLANGSMSSSQNNEGIIRKAMIEADVVDCMVALPPQLFFNTQIPACLWFLTKDKRAQPSSSGAVGQTKTRDRRGEVLFIDARKLGSLVTRVNREFSDEDVAKIAATYHAWRGDAEAGTAPYADEAGFCKSVKKDEIATHDYVLTPGRYVGSEAVDDDDEAFAEKMQRLTVQLSEQMAEGARLDALIKQRLAKVGYDV